MKYRVFRPPKKYPHGCTYEVEKFDSGCDIYRVINDREYAAYKSSKQFQCQVQDSRDHKRIYLGRIEKKNMRNFIQNMWQTSEKPDSFQ